MANNISAAIASHAARNRFRPAGFKLILFNITMSSKAVNQR